jgi:hypothetical protein
VDSQQMAVLGMQPLPHGLLPAGQLKPEPLEQAASERAIVSRTASRMVPPHAHPQLAGTPAPPNQ